MLCCCRVVCVRSGASSGVHVYVQSSSSDTDIASTAAASWPPPTQSSWTSALHKAQTAGVGGPWREINLARTDGQNFAQKLEAILSCLMPDRTVADCSV